MFSWPLLKYSDHRLTGSRIIKSVTFCNQKFLALFYLISTQNTSVNEIIRSLLSLLCSPKVILISGGHYNAFICREKPSYFWQEIFKIDLCIKIQKRNILLTHFLSLQIFRKTHTFVQSKHLPRKKWHFISQHIFSRNYLSLKRPLLVSNIRQN